MTATALYESQQLHAGLLAVAVHGAFFALLYFGFSWQSQAVRTMSVDLWQSLPEHQLKVVPSVVPKAVQRSKPRKPPKKPEPIRPPQPDKLIKPDIVLQDKKVRKKIRKKVVKPVMPKPDIKKPVEEITAEQIAEEQALLAEREMVEQAERERIAQSSVMDAVVNEYVAKITAKIRRNVVMPPDVRDDALARFSVTLLPGGAVLSVKLKKPSGNVAYDNAVERAILKSEPLPLPPDTSLFKKFRDLNLKFSPK